MFISGSRVCKSDCKLQCCQSCTFCTTQWTVSKERFKSQIERKINKVCERCLFCKSLSFCSSCHKCSQFSRKTSCGRPSAKPSAQATKFNNKLPLFISPPSGSDGLEGGRIESLTGGADCLCLSSSIFPRSGCLQGGRPRLPTDDPDCPRMAEHALVLGSGQPIGSSTTVATTGGEPTEATLQQVPPQGPLQSKPACLAP